MDKILECSVRKHAIGKDSVVPVTIEVVTDTIRFGCLREEWNRLVESAPTTPFQTYEWSYLWWRYFGSRNRNLHILLFRKDDKLVGIAPLFLETVHVAGVLLYRRLKFLACDVPDSPVTPFYRDYGLTDYLDFIVLPGYEQDVARLSVRYLQAHTTLFDEASFVNVQRSGFVATHFLKELIISGLQHRIHRLDVCPRIVLNGSLEQYLSSLNGHHRRRMRKAKGVLLEAKYLRIAVPETPEACDRLLAELIRLHQRRWNKLGYPGLFYDKRFESFHRDVMHAFSDRGWLWIRGADAGGCTISVRLGFFFRDVFYDFLSGIDDECEDSKHRPGIGLLAKALEDALEKGCSVVDLLRGGEQYKMELANDLRYNWKIVVFNPATVETIRTKAARVIGSLVRPLSRAQMEWRMLNVLCTFHGALRGALQYLKKRFGSIILKVQRRRSLSVAQRLDAVEEFVRRPLERVQERAPLARRILNSLERDRNIPLFRKVVKAFIYVRSLLLARAYLFRCDQVGKRCRTRGKPYIVNDGRIIIGDDFNLSSRIVRSELATGYKGTLEIGNDVSINFGALISSQERVTIGNHVRIGPYSIITDSDFHSIGNPYEAPRGVPTVIEDDVWLGARVTVLKGSRIGRGSVVSAGSVVSGIIPPDVIAGGVPARVIRSAKPNLSSNSRKSNGSVSVEIVRRVKEVFAKTFGVEVSDLSWGPGRIARWDSLGHLNLVLNLETEFKTSIGETDILRISSVAEACRIMEQLLTRNNGTVVETRSNERRE